MSGPARAKDQALKARAARVIPGGMYGHMNTRRLPAGYPQFFARAEGAYLWDADGNRYIDFMCAYGPMVLGYHNREIDAAFDAQRERADIANGPTERLVELAEKLTQTIAHADWALFQKNGTDATTFCVTLARAATGRRKILAARGAYHGSVPWCSPYPQGVTAEDRAHLVLFDYNDVASLEAAARAVEGDLAGIIVSAFKHDYGKDQEMPTPAFAAKARALCDAAGAVLILDDVRAGFRLHMGGSWELVGVRPDLSAFSKAIANGYPLAAVTGVERLREVAANQFMTGSFWCGAGAMAASLKTLELLERTDAIARMAALGERFRKGLAEQARSHNLGLRQTGPAQMPMVLFEDDADCAKGFRFVEEALKRGVYLHPQHNMFLSAAHTEADIDAALAATDESLRVVRREFGRD
jgi:glutamate-1-semialdehyde 2,1-aminomutase